MALAWLFALFAGVVNACALQVTSTHGHAEPGGVNRAAIEDGAAVITAGHRGLIAAHHIDGVDQAQPSCLKACDEASRVMLATVADPIDPGAAPLIAHAWDARRLAIVSPSRTGDPREALPPRPPPRLLFSTLLL
jgi:hypothetical protein